MSIIINPRKGPFVNRETAFGGELALSNSLGANLVNAWNHLRRWRAGEYIASYSGRVDPAINGDNLSKFHIITRFPEQVDGSDVQIVVTQKNWMIGYAGAVNEKTEWRKLFGGAVTETPYDSLAPPNTITIGDTATSLPSGDYHEYEFEVTPEAIGTADGFRCSRLDITNAVVHQLNVFGCPIEPDIDKASALVGLSDVAVGQTMRGFIQGTSDGTVGALIHYMDDDGTNGVDSVVHNSCRPLFQTPYALGVHLNNEANYIPIRSDANDVSMTYKVKARNLTGNAVDDVACDPAIVISGDAGARIKMSSTTAADNVVYTIPGGGIPQAVPELKTTTDFGDTLNIDPAGDTITIEALSGAGNDVWIQTVSLWEGYRYR